MSKLVFFLTGRSIVFRLLIITMLLSAFSIKENKGDELKFILYNNYVIIESRVGDDSFLQYRFGLVGINKLLAIDEISINYHGINHTTKSGTDYIGPYIVCYRHGSKAFQEKFTGGWHGKNGDASGLPTATMRESHVYSDGRLIDNKFGIGYTEKVEIHCINDVMAYNTDFPVLEEDVRYIISKDGINVQVILKAKTDIIISRYYGLQAQKPSWAEKVVYHYNNCDFEEYDVSINSESKPIGYSNDNVDKIEFKSDSIPLSFFMSVERENDLTQGTYVDKKMPWAFTKSYGKSYFNMVNGKELKMTKGQEIKFSGSYHFE